MTIIRAGGCGVEWEGTANEKEKESLAFFDDEVKRVRTFESKYLKAFLL